MVKPSRLAISQSSSAQDAYSDRDKWMYERSKVCLLPCRTACKKLGHDQSIAAQFLSARSSYTWLVIFGAFFIRPSSGMEVATIALLLTSR